jgi:hypothetical protein
MDSQLLVSDPDVGRIVRVPPKDQRASWFRRVAHSTFIGLRPDRRETLPRGRLGDAGRNFDSSVLLRTLRDRCRYTTATSACHYPNRCDETTQAAYLARMWLTNTMAGVPVSINYDWSNGSDNATDCESNFGAVRHEPTGRPAEPFSPKPKCANTKSWSILWALLCSDSD